MQVSVGDTITLKYRPGHVDGPHEIVEVRVLEVEADGSSMEVQAVDPAEDQAPWSVLQVEIDRANPQILPVPVVGGGQRTVGEDAADPRPGILPAVPHADVPERRCLKFESDEPMPHAAHRWYNDDIPSSDERPVSFSGRICWCPGLPDLTPAERVAEHQGIPTPDVRLHGHVEVLQDADDGRWWVLVDGDLWSPAPWVAPHGYASREAAHEVVSAYAGTILHDVGERP